MKRFLLILSLIFASFNAFAICNTDVCADGIYMSESGSNIFIQEFHTHEGHTFVVGWARLNPELQAYDLYISSTMPMTEFNMSVNGVLMLPVVLTQSILNTKIPALVTLQIEINPSPSLTPYTVKEVTMESEFGIFTHTRIGR